LSIPEGTLLGPFEILDRLGSGGMGEVYRARDTRLGREVAVKALPKELLTDQSFLQRFAQEARSASALNHPNIITIFEIGQVDSVPFMAMELIEGRTLRELMARGPLTMRTVLSLGAQLADGLSKAHEAGIVHRDLKPENLMVSKDGFLKILDFGLAKVVGPFAGAGTGEVFNQSLTATGHVLGTAGYMSPEQASGRPIDFRSDQFSVGLILYEMVTGRRAFDRATPVQTLSAIIQEDPEPLERLCPKLPLPFRWTIERCLAKEPDERYASTRDLVRDLKQLRDNIANLGDAGLSRALPEVTATAPRPGVRTTSSVQTRSMTPAPTAQTAIVPAPTKGRRVADFLGVLFVGLVLFAAGAGGGFWFRGRALDAPPPDLQGDLLLSPSTRVISPRISPDGTTLAFVTIQDGVAQVAVMKPASGDWTVLTRARGVGSIYKVDWSRDGSRLFFDRVTDVPHGVYSVSVLGGEERLVLPDAQGPEALPDGSLLAVRIDADRNFQPHRFFPDTGKLQPVGPAIVPESLGLSLRATSDGSEVVFWGKPPGEPGSHAFALDLSSGKTRRIAPELPLSPPVAIGADGRSVLAVVVSGDLHRITSIAADGREARTLLTLTSRPSSITASRDAGLFVSTLDNPVDVLKFSPAGGVPERLAGAGNVVMSPVQLPDGRIIVPSLVSGRRRLLVASAAGNLRSLVESSEAASPPAVLVGDSLVAFVSGGGGKRPTISLASVADGRIVKRLESTTGAVPQGLAASPDGRTLYYVDAGSVFSVDIDKGEKAPPRKLRAGNGVAVDPKRQELLVQLNEKDGVKLVAVPLAGGAERPVIYQTSTLRLTPLPLSAGAVGPDGRVVVTAASKDSWYWGPALLDPLTGAVERVPVIFDGDVQATTWSRDGSLLGMGVAMRSQLWRFRERAATGDTAP
jgi:tRNA A-37 threonylcarbamoyl transferase component Bud32/Tol biopolymer transport system component